MTPLMVDVLLATLPMVAGGGHHLVSRMAKMEARCKDSSAPLPLRRIVCLRRSLECASGLAASGPVRSRGAHMVLQQAWASLGTPWKIPNATYGFPERRCDPWVNVCKSVWGRTEHDTRYAVT